MIAGVICLNGEEDPGFGRSSGPARQASVLACHLREVADWNERSILRDKCCGNALTLSSRVCVFMYGRAASSSLYYDQPTVYSSRILAQARH